MLLGATAPCLYPIKPYKEHHDYSHDWLINSPFRRLFLVLHWGLVHILFYIEKFITQFKTIEKKIIGHRIRFREKMTIYLCSEVHPYRKEKAAIFLMRTRNYAQ